MTKIAYFINLPSIIQFHFRSNCAKAQQFHPLSSILHFPVLKLKPELSRAQNPQHIAWHYLHKQATTIQCYTCSIAVLFKVQRLTAKKKNPGAVVSNAALQSQHQVSFPPLGTLASFFKTSWSTMVQNLGASALSSIACLIYIIAASCSLGSKHCMYTYKLSKPESQRVPQEYIWHAIV